MIEKKHPNRKFKNRFRKEPLEMKIKKVLLFRDRRKFCVIDKV